METLLFNGVDLTPFGVVLGTAILFVIAFLLPVIKKPAAKQSK